MRYIHRKNIKFKNEIATADKSKILGVAIDPAKDFHRAIVFSFDGKLLVESFSFDSLRTGYELLTRNIDKAKKKIKASKIYIGLEQAGTYSENLYNHLIKDFEDVYFISPNAVANNRKQKMLFGLKSDDIDAGAVGDLLIRGEFMEHYESALLYKKIRNLIYYREKKIVLRSILKNQLMFRLDRVYPGINNSFGENKPMFSKTKFTHVTFNGLLKSGKTIRQLIKTSNDKLYDEFGYKTPSSGPKKIRELKVRLNNILAPEERLAKAELHLLKKDMGIFNYINNEIVSVENEIVELGKKTDAKYLMGQIKGISDVMAVTYVGLVGNFRNYKSAGHVYSLSGLSPKVHQSGTGSLTGSLGIRRTGNKQLRSMLYKMACQVMVCEPVFREFNNRLKATGKHWKKNRISLCRKLNKTMFALIRDRVPFNRSATVSST